MTAEARCNCKTLLLWINLLILCFCLTLWWDVFRSWSSLHSELGGCRNSNRALGRVERVTGWLGLKAWGGLKKLLEKKRRVVQTFWLVCASRVLDWRIFLHPSGHRVVSASCAGGAEWSRLWRYASRIYGCGCSFCRYFIVHKKINFKNLYYPQSNVIL